jgi:2-polyprenyl-3-methyl-5-hydroxy-6-metoxy-1,4-benzoquinol methylase
MKDGLEVCKRKERMSCNENQIGNQSWWTRNMMAYDWHNEVQAERFSSDWFDAIDKAHIYGARLFATDKKPFDRTIPLDRLHGKKVLEIGCGMGLHTETMVRAGADVTSIDITETAVEATKRRLELKGLSACVFRANAEEMPFESGCFDFVWSWGVIHHSARTTRIVREIARVLAPEGECRVMVYNRNGTSAGVCYLRQHLLGGGIFRGSFDETLWNNTDGFSARYYVHEQFEDMFRAFFKEVQSEICGQDSDVIPLPRRFRRMVLRYLSETYQRKAQATRGGFLFLKASLPF